MSSIDDSEEDWIEAQLSKTTTINVQLPRSTACAMAAGAEEE